MIYGIVGLGLIGGSLAKAFHAAGFAVYGADRDASMQEFALLSNVLTGALDASTIGQCDCLLLAISPAAACQWLEEHAAQIPASCLVMDCCGTKLRVCQTGFRLASQYGFTFVGGHPMAGTHHWGFASSREDLFQGACFVAVPPVYDDIRLLERVKQAVLPAGFASVSVTTAQEHDRVIAFTSQMPHIVSNAFIKSPTARDHQGVSAGSYRDLTRVAWLNPPMWAELFLENREPLLHEMDTLISSLQQYRDAIFHEDQQRLTALLADGCRIKKEVDG